MMADDACTQEVGRSARALAGDANLGPVALLGVALLSANMAAAQSVDYPAPTSRENVGDWVLECYDPPIDQCQIYQRMLINNGTAAAMVTTFAWDSAAREMRTQIALPLGISLSKGATISSDDGSVVTVPISRCTQQGCLVEGVISDAMLASFDRSSSARVSVVDGNGKDFVVPMSLDGFTEAIGRLRPDENEINDDNLSPVTGGG